MLCNRSKHADGLKTLLRGIRDRVPDIGGSRLESYFHSEGEPSLDAIIEFGVYSQAIPKSGACRKKRKASDYFDGIGGPIYGEGDY